MTTYINDSEEDSARLDMEYYGEADMSTENLKKYNAEVAATGGYDVGEYPGFAIGLIYPIKLNDVAVEEFTPYAKMAINYYNEHNPGNFKLLKLLKGNIQGCSGVKYYLTFEAKDTDNGKVETFQGLVWRGIPGKNGEPDDEVLQCRIKPLLKKWRDLETAYCVFLSICNLVARMCIYGCYIL